jgi:hypothetical protein
LIEGFRDAQPWPSPAAVVRAAPRERPSISAGRIQGLYEFEALARGHRVIQQCGREAALRPGDLTLVDLSSPATWVSSDARYVAAVFPRSLLPLRVTDVARLAAVRIPGDRGAGALISSLARQLPGHLDGVTQSGGARLADAVLDLLAVALADGLDRATELPFETRRERCCNARMR